MNHTPTHTYVVILAGGGGTRLWPHSRRRRPKQFLPMLPGHETLLGATARRTAAVAPLQRTLVVTAASQVEEVRRCLPDLPIDNILVEPLGRNTAPAIGLAAVAVQRRDPQGVMLVLPSDHFVSDEAGFAALLLRAAAAASEGHVVTIGVRPSHPETGFGYIRVSGDMAAPAGQALPLAEAFVEKPDAATAAAYLADGHYLWNSGMFFFPAARVLRELRQHLPRLAEILDDIAVHPERTAARYPEAPAISIDYAVMERLGAAALGAEAEARAIRVLPGDFGWNDVGSFAALQALWPADERGNHLLHSPAEGAGAAPPAAPVVIDGSRNVVWSATGQLVSTVGLSDLVIAVTEDAILILPRERAQDVRQVVDQLNQKGRSEYL